ncbi:hypothetical protein GR925_38835 [Streptomyces sp. HUCO-GS316]|uniref:hypothetical protein n=1 Tax=Streptomyces sp. HUCO-GS316 TaxID=2692198 RepID=UPI00136888A3|nr:hypothetical protein [Streptomyces sp. HUCO-GS316]MXM69191.1 hypothetical protein [Streptomyces sp. HUCO-GS316]
MNSYALTALRARAFAAAIQAAPALLEERGARVAVVAELEQVAETLGSLPAPAADSRTVPPALRAFALRVLPYLGRRSGIPSAVMTYVFEPITGRGPQCIGLNPHSPHLARQEAELKVGIRTMHELLGQQNADTVRDAFLNLLRLHKRYDRLGNVVAEDNARTCHA